MAISPDQPTDKTLYRQCDLRHGDWRTVSWIPAKFAVEGDVLSLRNEGSVWSAGWTVHRAYQFNDRPANWRAAVKAHRKNTGDSLPKECPHQEK